MNQRRTSYANIVSGTTALSRPPRAGAVSHMLNPTDSDSQSGLYGHARNTRVESPFAQARNGTPDSGSGIWQPRLGTGLPWFSSAFESFMTKDSIMSLSAAEGEPFSGGTPNPSYTGFLSPTYLRGSVYLQRLEEAHKTRLAAEREGHAAKAQVGTGLTGGGNTHLPKSKLPSGSHRGVAYELIEKQPAHEADEGISQLPSRWNRDDKDPNLEVMGDGYEVKYTGRSTSDHEACAIRADHYMPPQCGIYYFEVLVLNRKREE